MGDSLCGHLWATELPWMHRKRRLVKFRRPQCVSEFRLRARYIHQQDCILTFMLYIAQSQAAVVAVAVRAMAAAATITFALHLYFKSSWNSVQIQTQLVVATQFISLRNLKLPESLHCAGTTAPWSPLILPFRADDRQYTNGRC